MLAKAKELTAASRAGNLSLVRKIAEELGVEDASKPEFVQRWTEEDCDRYKKQNRLDQELERAVQGQERNYRGDVSHSIKGQADAVKAILAAGANPNAVDQYSRTALQLATKSGNAEVVSVLLSAGANPNTENGNYEVPLIQAASLGGSIAVVNALLAGEANPNMENGKGLTPLIVAVKWWRTETVSVLLAAGANPGMRLIRKVRRPWIMQSIECIARVLPKWCGHIGKLSDF